MQIELMVLAIFLLIFSIIDLKFKQIPSVFLTGVLFIILALNPGNIYFGLLSVIFALFLYEFDFIGGIADIKVMAMIGLVISSITSLAIFLLIMMIYGIAWKILIKWRMRYAKEIAFIPVLFFAYITLLITQLI